MRLWFRAIGYECLLSKGNSRLGCQITDTEEMDGLVVRLPLGQH